MRIPRLLLVLGLVLLVGAVLVLRRSGEEPRADDRPHLVLIIIDTLRADRLGCYGYERDVSPELDALSRRGVRFARAVAQCSWTRPSIGSLLTSHYPRELGLHYETRGGLPEEVVTLAEALKESGYRTLGATANPHLNTTFRFHQGFDRYLDSARIFHWMPEAPGQTPEGHPPLASARDLFGRMLAEIDGEGAAERARPHYLQLDVMEVHETWGENDLVRPELEELFPGVRYDKERRYLQAIRQVSLDVDWFLSELGKRPGWEDALVVLTSDHGEGLGSHPGVPESDSHGLLLYESQVMVPWILLRTGGPFPEGLVVEQPVRLLDLMPTLLDLLDVREPRGMRGTSLVPLLEGLTADLPERFVVETHFRGADKLGVYAGDWKLFRNGDRQAGLPRVALHRMGVREDGARTNEAVRHPELVRELHDYLKRWEREHPPAEPVELGGEIPPETLEQLRSLGYGG